MNDEVKNKLYQLAYEAAMNQKEAREKNEYGTKEIIRVSEVKIISEIEKENFFRILLKTKFEDNKEGIYQSLSRIKYANVELLSEPVRKRNLEYSKKCLEISELLLVLKTDTNGIVISSAMQKCKLPENLKKKMEKEVEAQYRNYELDLEPMPYEEAEDILTAAFSFPEYDEEGPTGATAWLCYQYDVTLGEFIEYCYGDTPTDEDIESFAEDNLIPCEQITLEQIQKNIKLYRKKVSEYSKKGRPIKNPKLNAAVLMFADYGLECSNEEFRTIYECLDYFELIDDDLKRDWAKKEKDIKYSGMQYIKSVFGRSKRMKLDMPDPLPF